MLRSIDHVTNFVVQLTYVSFVMQEMQSGVLMLLLYLARGCHLNLYEGVVVILDFQDGVKHGNIFYILLTCILSCRRIP